MSNRIGVATVKDVGEYIAERLANLVHPVQDHFFPMRQNAIRVSSQLHDISSGSKLTTQLKEDGQFFIDTIRDAQGLVLKTLKGDDKLLIQYLKLVLSQGLSSTMELSKSFLRSLQLEIDGIAFAAYSFLNDRFPDIEDINSDDLLKLPSESEATAENVNKFMKDVGRVLNKLWEEKAKPKSQKLLTEMLSCLLEHKTWSDNRRGTFVPVSRIRDSEIYKELARIAGDFKYHFEKNFINQSSRLETA